MRPYLILPLIGLVAALHAAATPAQTADDLVQQYLAARGGYARLKALTSVRFVRTYGTFGANIPVTIAKKRSGFYRSDQALPGRPKVTRGLAPSGAWEQIDTAVSRRPADQELELRETDGDFDGFLVDYREKGHTIEYAGRARTGGIDTHRIVVHLRSGAVRQVYLDASTALVRKEQGTMHVTQQPEPVAVTITYGDWRDVGGLKFPFAIDEERDTFPPQSFAIYTERIELDPPLEDGWFVMPTP